MLRLNRTASKSGGMGLLEGLKELEGAPLPAVNTTASVDVNEGASVVGDGGAEAMMEQFSSGAASVFSNLGVFGATIGESAAHATTHVRRLLGDADADADLEAPVQATLGDEVSALCSLTLMQRLALFAMTFGAGVLMLMTAVTFLPLLVVAPHKFAAAFTMGNVLCITSTWTLTGPRAQLRAMFQPARATAAAMYLGSLLAVMASAFLGGNFRYPLVLVCLFVEIIARKYIGYIYIYIYIYQREN